MSAKRQKGFTLAEVLITLAIIGVVAALTTPAIIRNSQNAKIGPQMAKIFSTIETATQAACVDQEKHYFKDVVNPDDIGGTLDLASQLKLLSEKFMKAKEYSFSEGESLPPVVGMNYAAYEDIPDVYTIFMFTDKSAILVPSCTLGTTPGEDGEEPSVTDHCRIFGLMPGFAKRTRLMLGRDIFPFYITKDGDVITPKEAGDETEQDSCTDENIAAGSITGYGCINRIADNGWKADW